LDLATKEHQAAEQRFAVDSLVRLRSWKGRFCCAEAQLLIVRLDLEEIARQAVNPGASCRCPRGRPGLVGDRLRIEMTMLQKALRFCKHWRGMFEARGHRRDE
jgi:hypothetical protein